MSNISNVPVFWILKVQMLHFNIHKPFIVATLFKKKSKRYLLDDKYLLETY